MLRIGDAFSRVFCAAILLSLSTGAYAERVTSISPEDLGRWKSDGNGGCYFDPNDDGPDQCSPPSGRWKFDGSVCYWAANDSGPNQCDPTSPDPPDGTPIPQWNESIQPTELSEADGFGPTALPVIPSCSSATKKGKTGYITVQMIPAGFVQWGAGMYAPTWNYGPWWASVTVNGQLVDQKGPPSQMYPPHGSLAPNQLPPGAIVNIFVIHVFPYFYWNVFWTPELGWGYTWAVYWARTHGSLSCRLPL